MVVIFTPPVTIATQFWLQVSLQFIWFHIILPNENIHTWLFADSGAKKQQYNEKNHVKNFLLALNERKLKESVNRIHVINSIPMLLHNIIIFFMILINTIINCCFYISLFTFCRACPSFSCPASILTTAFGVPNIFISLCSASAMFAVLQINSMNATRNALSLNE